MAEPESGFLAYASKYSADAIQARKDLPPEILPVLLNLIDMLADNPDARLDRTRALGTDGRIFIYTHPQPPLQITYELDREKRLLYLLHFVAPRVPITRPVFISYCHKDSEWLVKLKMFLVPLEEQGLIRVWDDTEIRPGSDWLEEIKKSLESARVAVFLITQNFLSSQFIRERELPALLKRAENRGCQIFWIAVSASTVRDSEIWRFQAGNNPEQPLDSLSVPEQNRVLAEIYDRMKAAVRDS